MLHIHTYAKKFRKPKSLENTHSHNTHTQPLRFNCWFKSDSKHTQILPGDSRGGGRKTRPRWCPRGCWLQGTSEINTASELGQGGSIVDYKMQKLWSNQRHPSYEYYPKTNPKMPYQLCPYLDGFVVWVLLLVELGGREVDRLIVLQLDCLVFKGTMSFFQKDLSILQ